ncbi:hypothetical protein ZIOFF_071464 [Zingiber officinale]|uniref:Uncharacterized protein n=1 Tax=Zingiber officinale TaxID=94328 RepID=A0A8J5C168_ZINOF|nr:hypothetical protein ZIOFF_071464 [Zingiber officinale]
MSGISVLMSSWSGAVGEFNNFLMISGLLNAGLWENWPLETAIEIKKAKRTLGSNVLGFGFVVLLVVLMSRLKVLAGYTCFLEFASAFVWLEFGCQWDCSVYGFRGVRLAVIGLVPIISMSLKLRALCMLPVCLNVWLRDIMACLYANAKLILTLTIILNLQFSHLSHRTLSTQASDRFNINSQLEHLQAKYVGTGHADLNRFEWGVNIQRDSYASYIGHYPILAYFSVAENESIGRQRYNFMQVRLDPASSSIIYINSQLPI